MPACCWLTGPSLNIRDVQQPSLVPLATAASLRWGPQAAPALNDHAWVLASHASVALGPPVLTMHDADMVCFAVCRGPQLQAAITTTATSTPISPLLLLRWMKSKTQQISRQQILRLPWP